LNLIPGLDAAFLDIVRMHTAGDPMQMGVLWTNLSQRRIAAQLKPRGFRVSVTVVRQLLRRHRLGRRKARKTRPLKRHRDRDRQFMNIARWRAAYESSANPILSIDTKKKEFIGDLYRDGRAYTNQTVAALDHDFPSAARGVVYPHGLYDVKRNQGHINLGISHDTSRFACDSIAYWWDNNGHEHYPQATSILLLCDGGGSNGSNRHVFKYALQQLANRLGLEIRVAHYPPYTSKYNLIEHRFFPHVTRACQGVLFTSVDLVVEKMAEASTSTGLRTTVHVLSGDYPTGEKAPKNYKKTRVIVFDDELPAWNYRAVPQKPGSY
jgi:Rhodopirellula transposase DDE domain